MYKKYLDLAVNKGFTTSFFDLYGRLGFDDRARPMEQCLSSAPKQVQELLNGHRGWGSSSIRRRSHMQSKRVARFSMIAALLAVVYGFSVTVPSALAEDEDGRGGGCSNATLHGPYGLTIDATTAPGAALLFRGVVLQNYDGAGHLTIRDHIVFDGTPETDTWTPGTGSYLVHPDCTGVATFSLPSEGPPLKVHFVVVERGRKLREVIDVNAITVTGEKVD